MYQGWFHPNFRNGFIHVSGMVSFMFQGRFHHVSGMVSSCFSNGSVSLGERSLLFFSLSGPNKHRRTPPNIAADLRLSAAAPPLMAAAAAVAGRKLPRVFIEVVGCRDLQQRSRV